MKPGINGRALRGWCGMVALALLAGCGGGGEAPAGGLAALSAPAYEQPAHAAQSAAAQPLAGVLRAPLLPVRVELGPISEAKAVAEAPVLGPRQIGLARQAGPTASVAGTQQMLRWRPSSQGGWAAAVSFSAEGAYGLRLGVLVGQLPPEAVLRVYRQDQPAAVFETSGQAVLQAIARNVQAGDGSDAAHTWWTPDSGGGEATLEIELPPGTPVSSVQVAVPQVSHFFVNLSLPVEDESVWQPKLGESGACELDALCHSEYEAVRNAVARMIYTSGGTSYLCTGTLLNDQNSSGTPYFLSANHCISSQTVASTLQTFWFYRSPSCGSRSLSSSAVSRTGGATLLYASASTDTSFLKLLDTPPPGAMFAGWDASPQAPGTAVAGLHHPKGDLLKISFGAVGSLYACTGVSGASFSCYADPSGNFYRVGWTQGQAEGGSSGSGIFHGNTLVGTLYGGTALCSAQGLAFYGRFDVAYAAALRNWLSPGSATPQPPAAPFPASLTGWVDQLGRILSPLSPLSPS
ncbi:MAG: serine protease [Acidovorax sp.]|nr:serine protease [Acidovorax sp.]